MFCSTFCFEIPTGYGLVSPPSVQPHSPVGGRWSSHLCVTLRCFVGELSPRFRRQAVGTVNREKGESDPRAASRASSYRWSITRVNWLSMSDVEGRADQEPTHAAACRWRTRGAPRAAPDSIHILPDLRGSFGLCTSLRYWMGSTGSKLLLNAGALELHKKVCLWN